jgi:hypothetical protein
MFSNLMKIAFLLCVSVNAQVIPIIIPSYHGDYGNMSTKEAIALLIAMNIPSVLIVVIRSLLWLIKRPAWTYKEYVWYSDMALMTPDCNTFFLVVLNGIAGITALAFFITKIL